jgi:hypothetical protein
MLFNPNFQGGNVAQLNVCQPTDPKVISVSCHITNYAMSNYSGYSPASRLALVWKDQEVIVMAKNEK